MLSQFEKKYQNNKKVEKYFLSCFIYGRLHVIVILKFLKTETIIYHFISMYIFLL